VETENCLFSIIIPAFNEADCIADTLKAIQQFPPPSPYEVIVADNGSTDETVEIAANYSTHVVHAPDNTIAAVRNRGVDASCGQYLIFLDADVLVTEEWHLRMTDILNQLNDTPMLVTGSRCLPVNNSTWLNKYWFSLLKKHKGSYINSGHLITSRLLFNKISGFSESLNTAEDYDFCMKAQAIGATIRQSDIIPVMHLGYPTNISGFINRERWHGREDFLTLLSFSKSKVGWVAAFNLLFITGSSIASIVLSDSSPIVLYFLLMYMMSITLAIVKFRVLAPVFILNTAVIFYLYITGRTLAFLDRIFSGVKD
jgi:glycosyltransferase involved in cell wall biosynthesis